MSAIIYTSLIMHADVSLSLPVEGVGIPENALDGFSHTRWNPVAGTDFTYFTVSLIFPVSVNYFSVSGHNLEKDAVNLSILSLQATNEDDLSGWVQISSISQNEFKTGLKLRHFSSTQDFRHWRIFINYQDNSSIEAAEIANVFIGTRLILPNGLKPGYTIPLLSTLANIKNNKTIGGNFIGRSVLNRQYEFEIKQNNVSHQWFIDNWNDLLNIIQRQSFMFLWSDADLLDIVFCWTDGDIKPPVYDDQLYGSFNIKCSGYIENGS